MAKELLADYSLTAECYDEMLAAPLEPRAHDRCRTLASGERTRSGCRPQRRVRENGHLQCLRRSAGRRPP
jgi:hypothetical protein